MFLQQVNKYLTDRQNAMQLFPVQRRSTITHWTNCQISRVTSYALLRSVSLKYRKYSIIHLLVRLFQKKSFYFKKLQSTKSIEEWFPHFTDIHHARWMGCYQLRSSKLQTQKADFWLSYRWLLNSSRFSLRYLQHDTSNILFQRILRPKFIYLLSTSLINNFVVPEQFKIRSLLSTTNSCVFVYPKYTRRFKRSSYFFLLILQENKFVHMDWLFSVFHYDSKYSFTLFPLANNFKISIFKRLNFQKLWLLSQLDSFSIYTSKQFSLTASSVNHSFKSFALRKLDFNATSIPSWTSILYKNRLKLNSLSSLTRHLRIRRIRFKPGYMRIWRDSRVNIQEILEMRIRYQYRLTTKLQQLHRQQQSRVFTYSTTTIFFILLGSQISVDMWSTLELLRSDSIYLNGKICTNSFVHLFLHDCVQALINIKFYFLVRFLQNRGIWTFTRINKIFYRKFRIKGSNTDVRMRKKLPWTFLHLQNSYLDVLPYLEVDYFTLSSFVILDQRAAKFWLPVRAYTLELNILNMYNWKYIT